VLRSALIRGNPDRKDQGRIVQFHRGLARVFYRGFVIFLVRGSVYIVCPSVLGLNNLKTKQNIRILAIGLKPTCN